LNDVLGAIKIATKTTPTVLFSSARNVDVETNILDIQKIQTWFNWKPATSFQTALSETWEWVKSSN
jgi:UDP-glucose 4-epimerase